jgi:hypothetical protein
VRAVVRRLRFPATRLVIAPTLTQATPPAAQIWSQQDGDDDQQHDVGKVDEIWHVEIQWNEEILCQMVFMPPMRSSANYQLFVRAVPPQEVGAATRSENVTSHKHRYQLFAWVVPPKSG